MTEQEIKDRFSERLRALMYQKKRYNKKELAEASGLSPKTIGRYRRAERLPSTTNLIKIANALDCTPEDLIPYERNKTE